LALAVVGGCGGGADSSSLVEPKNVFPDVDGSDAALEDVSPPPAHATECDLELILSGSKTHYIKEEGETVQFVDIVPGETSFLVISQTMRADATSGSGDCERLMDYGFLFHGGGLGFYALDGESGLLGAALAWDDASNSALLVQSFRHSEHHSPQLWLVRFDETCSVLDYPMPKLPADYALAPRKAVARSALRPGTFVIAGRMEEHLEKHTLDDASFDPDATPVDAFPGASYAMVAASPSMEATLAAGSTPGVTLTLEAPSMSVTTTDPERVAPFADLAVWDTRAFVVFPTPAGIHSWFTDGGSGLVAEQDLASPNYASLAAARLRDHVFVVGGTPEKIEIHRFDGAGSVSLDLSLALSRELSTGSGVDALAGFDGTKVAVAAARERVVAAWPNAVGYGWAVLECAQ